MICTISFIIGWFFIGLLDSYFLFRKFRDQDFLVEDLLLHLMYIILGPLSFLMTCIIILVDSSDKVLIKRKKK